MRKLGFGCMRLPLAEAGNFKAVDIAEVERMVDTFLERGFTYFDTAYMYHDFHSECVVREALVERHPRNSFTLATKLPTMFLKSEGDQERIFAEQLSKCGVDYFDYYLLHNLNTANYRTVERFDSFDTSDSRSTTARSCSTRSSRRTPKRSSCSCRSTTSTGTIPASSRTAATTWRAVTASRSW